MNNKEYHFYARQFLSLNGRENSDYEYRILTEPLAKISSKACLLWTIEVVERRLKLFHQDELSLKTLEELEKIKTDYNIDKARVFDELSFKNWRNRSDGTEELSIHLPLARVSWACLCSICKENNFEFLSKYRTGNNIPKKVFSNLGKYIGWECSHVLNIIFRNDSEVVDKIAFFYSKLMNKLEKNQNYIK